VFGMDRLAVAEAKFAAVHRDELRTVAHQVHLNAALRIIPDCRMMERTLVKIGPEFAVDTREQIEVEFCGDTRTVVVCRAQHFRIFHKIGAKHEGCRISELTPCPGEKLPATFRPEVSDGGARKESGLPAFSYL